MQRRVATYGVCKVALAHWAPPGSGGMDQAKASIMAIEFSSCDLCDAHKDDHSGTFRVLAPVVHDYGGQQAFAGCVVTVRCHEDNTQVKQILEQEPGQGRVLVVDGAGAVQRALVGGNIAAAAARNGWAGVVVNGAVRDIAELRAIPLGIRALALVPMPTSRAGQGQRDVAIQVQGTLVRPGEWLYADADGIVVSGHALHRVS